MCLGANNGGSAFLWAVSAIFKADLFFLNGFALFKPNRASGKKIVLQRGDLSRRQGFTPLNRAASQDECLVPTSAVPQETEEPPANCGVIVPAEETNVKASGQLSLPEA